MPRLKRRIEGTRRNDGDFAYPFSNPIISSGYR
jgi:hypothetical protein